MKIEHLAIWTTELERLKDFYVRFFGANAGDRYVNPGKAFESCYLSFLPALGWISCVARTSYPKVLSNRIGLSHLAFSVGSTERVDMLTEEVRRAGYVADGPRWTGHGYYESVIVDPDGNWIERTV